MTRARWLLLVLVLILGVPGVLFVAGYWYLHSGHATARVAAKLAEVFGGPVQVGTVAVGAHGSTLHDLRLFESGSGSAKTPWLQVNQVDTDVSPWDLARGEVMPRRLTLSGAEITLRFNQDGDLLTRLPTSGKTETTWPDLSLEDGKVTLQQEGRPDLVVQGVRATLRNQNGQLVLTGTAADPHWGSWTLNAATDPSLTAGSATLQTAQIHLTQPMLSGLPFVSPKVWEEAQLEGDTPVELTLRFQAKPEDFHYQVTLEPRRTRVHVAATDLHAEQAQGKVVVADKVVTLENVQGRAADGQVRTSGTLDFRDKANRLRLQVQVEGLNVKDLPASWGLPAKVEGRLTGHADLRITIADGKVRTDGTGQGVINDARVAGQPAEPIRLELRAAGDGYQFAALAPVRPGASATQVADTAPPPALPALDGLIVPALDGVQATGPAKRLSGKAPLAPRGRGVGGEGDRFLGPPPHPQPLSPKGRGALRIDSKPQAEPAEPQKPRYVEINLGMKDIDLEKFVQGLGLRLPFTVAGRLSFEVHAGIPVDTSRDWKTYRLKGSATLTWFVLEDLRLEDVAARVAYTDGVLRLEELRGRVPAGPPNVAGSFNGTAQVQLVPQGDLTARATLADIPLARVLSVVPAGVKLTGGNLSGTVSFQAPAAQLRDPSRWQAQGSLTTRQVRAEGWTVADATTGFRVERGLLTLTDVSAKLFDGELTGSGVVPLKPEQAGRVDLRFKDVDVGAVQKSMPAFPFPLEGKASGTLQATVPAAAGGQERKLTAKMDLSAPRLRVRGIPTERLQGTVEYQKGAVDYRFEGESLGGRFHLDGQVPAAAPEPAAPAPQAPAKEGHLRIEGARLSRLGEALGRPRALEPLRGTVQLDLTFRHEGPDWRPVGGGRLVINRLAWEMTELADRIQGDVGLTRGELRLRDIAGTLAQGELRGQMALSLERPDQGWFNLALDQAQAVQLLAPWPSLRTEVEGPVDARLRGTLGREVSGTGLVALGRGRVFGLTVTDWRLPLDFYFVPRRGRGQVDVRDSTAQAASGRVTGQASFTWDVGNRLDGNLRFYGVQLQQLLQSLGSLGQSGAGLVTGRVDFAGTDVRSPDDLTANIEASFQQTQAVNIPVLSQLVQFIPGLSSGTWFTSGDLRARLAGGVVRIQRLGLKGSLVQLFGAGTINLQGRLNLDVRANTGIGVNPRLLRLIGLRLPIAGPIPAGLILEASNLLSPRLIHLRVTGTIRSPTIQLEPITLLGQEAVLFFLGRAAGAGL